MRHSADKFWQKYSNLTCTLHLPTWRHLSSFCYMNCSNVSHEIFSLQRLKVIKYVQVHLEGHTMISERVHEGELNSNSWAHGTGKVPSHVNSMLSKRLKKMLSILCCFIFCKERVPQTALVKVLHVSGHGPFSQPALLLQTPLGSWGLSK